MKRLIFLKVGYREKPDEAFKQFRSELKKLPDIKLLKELPPQPQVIIEFPDNKYQEIYEELLKIDIVFVIDPILPGGEV